MFNVKPTNPNPVITKPIRGMTGCWLFNDNGILPRNIIPQKTQSSIISTSSLTCIDGLHGRGLSSSSVGDIRLGMSSELFSTTGGTILFSRRTLTNSIGDHGFGVATYNVNCAMGGHIGAWDTNVYFDFGNRTSNRLIASGKWSPNYSIVENWAFSAGYNGMFIFLNGVLLAYKSGIFTRSDNAEEVRLFSGNWYGSTPFAQEFYQYITCNVGLTPNEIQEWSENPYGMFAVNNNKKVYCVSNIPIKQGIGSLDIDAFEFTGFGVESIFGSGGFHLDPLDFSATGTENIIGYSELNIDAFEFTGFGVESIFGSGSLYLDSLDFSSVGSLAITGIGSIVIPSLTIAGIGVASYPDGLYYGNGGFELGSFTYRGKGEHRYVKKEPIYGNLSNYGLMSDIEKIKDFDILETSIIALTKILSHTWGVNLTKKRKKIDAFFIMTENSLYTQLKNRGVNNFPILAIRPTSISGNKTNTYNKVLANHGTTFGYSADGTVVHNIRLRPVIANLAVTFICDDTHDMFNFYKISIFNDSFSFKLGSDKSYVQIKARVDTANFTTDVSDGTEGDAFSAQISTQISLDTYVGYITDATIMTDFEFALGIGSDILSSVIRLEDVQA